MLRMYIVGRPPFLLHPLPELSLAYYIGEDKGLGSILAHFLATQSHYSYFDVCLVVVAI